MKRKILFFIMLIAFAGLFSLQSCEKEHGVIIEHYAFSMPAAPTPANEATIDVATATTVNLQWSTENKSGDPIVADVYYGGSTDNPPLYKTNLNVLTLTVPVEKGITYSWRVVMTDANGITTEGPLWTFTIFEPIGIFVGDFTADEPAEDYSYDVSFSKLDANTLECDNYWNSGWVVPFTLDFTTNTYSFALMTFQTGWTGEESGTIDPATGTMVGNYTIWHNGVVYETGEHTYTKK